MEPKTEQQNNGGEENRTRGASRHWRGEEVKTLLLVWRERQAWEEEESRAKYEAISSRLRELGVCRDWLDCKAQCANMALPDWRPTQALYKQTTQRPYVEDEEQTEADRREEATNLPEGNFHTKILYGIRNLFLGAFYMEVFFFTKSIIF